MIIVSLYPKESIRFLLSLMQFSKSKILVLPLLDHLLGRINKSDARKLDLTALLHLRFLSLSLPLLIRSASFATSRCGCQRPVVLSLFCQRMLPRAVSNWAKIFRTYVTQRGVSMTQVFLEKCSLKK